MTNEAASNDTLNCMRCKANLVTGLKCIHCDKYVHKSCAKRLNNIIIIDENDFQCCNFVNESETSKSEVDTIVNALFQLTDENDKIDIQIVRVLLTQKEQIIYELRERINILSKHVELVNAQVTSEVKKAKSKINLNPHTWPNLESRTSNVIVNTEGKPNVCNENTSDKVKSSETEQSDINGVNSENSTPTTSKSLWTEVVRRKTNNKRPPVIGNITDSSIKLMGVPKYVSLHVYRLGPGTKSAQVIDFIKPKFPEAKCEQLNSRNPEEYSSFKVDIYEENLNSALDANSWPSSACVRRFFFPRRKENSEALGNQGSRTQ